VSSGNPILGRIKNLEARVDDHDRRLDAHDRELHEVDKDIATLTDMVVQASSIGLRAVQRDRARLISRRRRSRTV
jgi:hypothetical protein